MKLKLELNVDTNCMLPASNYHYILHNYNNIVLNTLN